MNLELIAREILTEYNELKKRDSKPDFMAIIEKYYHEKNDGTYEHLKPFREQVTKICHQLQPPKKKGLKKKASDLYTEYFKKVEKDEIDRGVDVEILRDIGYQV